MLRKLTIFGGLTLVAAVSLSIAIGKTTGIDIVSLLRPLPEITPAFQRGFRSDAMLEINQLRQPNGVDSVAVDEDVQEFVNRFIASHPNAGEMNLEDVFDELQQEFPGAQYLAANLVSARTREELLETLNRWDAVSNSDFNSLTTGVFTSGRRLAVLGVMTRRIPKFTLDAANVAGGRFFNVCPHCNSTHALVLDKKARTLILTCPDCEKPFDVLAADTKGNMKRATEFMTGFVMPEDELMKYAQSDEEKVLAIWQQVASRCRYELDQNLAEVREAWKTPEETWNEKAGDCEDTSILLADALISAGFDARVAIGWNGNIGQHAWCVVKIGEQQYVLESTLEGNLDYKALVTLKDAQPYYKPEQLFDRDNLYFCAGEPELAAGDYFEDVIWNRLDVSVGPVLSAAMVVRN